jgi:DNA-binding Xre family transcriptional regulator
MLALNLKRVFALRGIEKPSGFMFKHGINRQTTYNLLRQETSVVKIEHIELLCRLLKCTPNDLFEWEGGADSLSANHPLNDLKRNQTVQSIKEMIKDIPLEKMENLIKE